MAQVTLDIPTRLIDGYAKKHRWNSNMGLTKAQFMKQHLSRRIKLEVLEVEATEQSDAMYATLKAEIDAINIT